MSKTVQLSHFDVGVFPQDLQSSPDESGPKAHAGTCLTATICGRLAETGWCISLSRTNRGSTHCGLTLSYG